MLKLTPSLFHYLLLIFFLISGSLFAAVQSIPHPQNFHEVDLVKKELNPKQVKKLKKKKRKIRKAREKVNNFFRNTKIKLGMIVLIAGILISVVARILISVFGFLGYIGVFLAIIGLVLLVWGLLESLA